MVLKFKIGLETLDPSQHELATDLEAVLNVAIVKAIATAKSSYPKVIHPIIEKMMNKANFSLDTNEFIEYVPPSPQTVFLAKKITGLDLSPRASNAFINAGLTYAYEIEELGNFDNVDNAGGKTKAEIGELWGTQSLVLWEVAKTTIAAAKELSKKD